MSRATELAEMLDRRDPLDRNCHIAATLLRQQEAVIRQMLEVLEDERYISKYSQVVHAIHAAKGVL